MTGERDYAALADEYVLGLLDAAEAVTIEADMEREPLLVAAIAASRERFLPLDAGAEAVPVRDDLWGRIEASLPPQAGPAAIDPALPANDNRTNGWRKIAVAAIAATVILAVGLSFSLMRTIDPVVVAVLVNDRGEVQAIVEDFGNESATVRMLVDFDVPPGKTIQAWTLPSREIGPVSLGLVDTARSVRLEGPVLQPPRDGQLYELTLEQAGGSPTGRPTGRILAKGLAKLAR
ncbi:MAG TPA: anti-sigma factor [Ensifer sp.]|jgi:anti-sigma-K factor RskA|uniref:anti-sigma factor n=1 Tax=Ensifer sp. TaxID=1872086 RepID=UPI002E12AECD|nr:anti-sigma factor [Ensifer sp.]